MSSIKEIQSKINRLSPEMMNDLERYLDDLLDKNNPKQTSGKLKMNWKGGLKDVKSDALELQKLSLDWRQK